MADEFKLIKKRSSLKAKLTTFTNYLDIVSSCQSLSELQRLELQSRFAKIDALYEDFDNLQTEIESLDTSVAKVEEAYVARQQFEDLYHPLVARARSLLASVAPSEQIFECAVSGGAASMQGGNGSRNFVRLPKVALPEYHGSYQFWLEYRDTYISLIHKNTDIDPINKFHYLRASLKGSAAEIIKNLDFTSDNYQVAWDLLCERYNNNRLLINNHVQALFNATPIQKESCSSLRQLIDLINKNLRALKTLNEPTDSWDTLLVYMMSNKLDSVTSRGWEEFRNSLSQSPSLSEFCTFISNKADLLETLEEKSNSKLTKQEYFKPKSFIIATNKNYSNTNTNLIIKKCPMCSLDHLLYTCETFRNLPIETRIKKAKEFKVCMNCLRSGHIEKRCRLSGCKYCKSKHNTLLHLDQSIPLPQIPMPSTSNNVALSADAIQPATSSHILLSTALVRVVSNSGERHDARVLLDNVKAVHLELVTDLTKESYMAALNRFVSRRGKPRNILSDNGTNFVGTSNELQRFLHSSNVASDMVQEGIQFSFAPPYSPHFNGLAEAVVRSTKHHLKRLLKLTHLTYEEMSTCLTQIEAILNSRPLTPLSSDPCDYSALTPAHLLIGRPLTSIPHPQVADVNITRLDRYHRIEHIKQHFWRRFNIEYVSMLQQKTKWSTSSGNLVLGTLVLIKDKLLPPLLWSLGRVVQVYPGSDGVTRVVEVKTKNGTIRRAFNNVCPLPLH
ncbi:uncharacterized protein LOC131853955 isoform X2 [Achroia grisella]|uniref:uncharacterized protein LOC131853955 isoform X2 n=1 Tax=Achroia grisella TaxID=688607 RepID=UPI0027D338B7|nr:uncharacterized protein LOC131853955 isoform X2 [Achroia grisella]